jgi:hypothetical protein
MARYVRAGLDRWLFAPAIANKAAPTRAEITASTVLTGQLSDVNGFQYKNNPEKVPDYSSAFDKEVPGFDSSDASSLGFWDDAASTTIRTALAKNTVGFIVRMPYGDTPTKRATVWPVRSTGPNDSTERGPAKFTVGFSVEDTPEVNAVIPA